MTNLDDRSITLDHISRDFRSIRYFGGGGDFVTKWPPAAILDERKSLSIAFLAISDKYATFIFLNKIHKMVAGGHFECPKINLDPLCLYFKSIRNFYFFEIFSQNGHRRRPFWMNENHFRSHFSPFQINTQLPHRQHCIF